ncbi:winged helix DNA-binding domain-containing protein [Microbacterium sp.]|uniref:winged helix DNA-binding domain-containing protein n=1 Tax=Microbacterium sp. TaxID=51671 RepID=UPI003340C9B7
MKQTRLLSERLRSHRLSAPARTVTDAAAHMLAVQSQDFVAGRWALGVRTRGATLRDVDRAFTRGRLVRAWTMRGTLHIVPAPDLGWILSVTADRQRQQAATRHRQLGVDTAMLTVAERALRERIAREGRGVTRAEAFEAFSAAGIDPTAQRGYHLLFALTVGGILCQGPVVGREQLFVLAEEWVPSSAEPDDPLSELFVRYIAGHGPAGVADFAWWSGLTLGTAREAAERSRGRVAEVEDGLFAALSAPRRSGDREVHALPAFDEYYLSYADRSTVCTAEQAAVVGPGKNGMVRATLVESGRLAGTWSHTGVRDGAVPVAEFFASASPGLTESAVAALERFRAFLV